ncbi:CRISPR-associated protein Cas4 [Leptospira inadai serovar Lyme str. 10]|uniref:CRISPR-associated exonuclease Cas4 n=3 Tax=Leptospira inadai TaxID=29506 RepID=V6HCT7_9LEPT|nr:CRISPR-associated protein Cas4 [Leptospira inadai]EQA36748.1 CRISPR-associated protein Cas4 [Leptospira inadai serovar Lyme str. 10]PNV75480.1 CRISPR-associated protein Cas4 [Leptospira inadai serovar Lyme]
MGLGGTHFNYYFICHRKLWLFSSGISMEHSSDLVEQGNLIHETSYPERRKRYREVLLTDIRIDFYDPKDKIVHEVKKSPSFEDAHIWQLKYYIFKLEENGLPGVKGLLEYPKHKRIKEVFLDESDKEKLSEITREIESILERKTPPDRLPKERCTNCSYFDFCWVAELEEEEK